MPKVSVDKFNALMAEEMPWAVDVGMTLESIDAGKAVMRLPFDDGMLRPGGTVSGPTMMALADATMYAVVLSAIGIVKLAVTISFNINFLHRPPPADLMADLADIMDDEDYTPEKRAHQIVWQAIKWGMEQ